MGTKITNIIQLVNVHLKSHSQNVMQSRNIKIDFNIFIFHQVQGGSPVIEYINEIQKKYR